MPSTVVNRTDTFEQWRVKTNTIGGALGDLNDLDARIVSRSTIVGATNELQGDIGTVANLVTTEKTNLVGAVNEVKAALVSFATDNIAAGDGITAAVVNGVVTLSNSSKGTSQNIFKNIAVSGQSNVVADNNDDTLTLVAGSNIQITTNATTDSITITGTTPLANNSTVNVTAGSGLSGGGSFTVDQAAGSTITITNADRGTSQNIFKNIVVANQTTVVADNNDDTLTLVAGQVDSIAGITIATDAGSDTITFAHADTSTVSNVTAVSRTYVTGITFDTYGHVKAVSTESNSTNLNTANAIVARDGSGGFNAGAINVTSITVPGTGGIAQYTGSSSSVFNTIGSSSTNNFAYGWDGTNALISTYNQNSPLILKASGVSFYTTAGNNQLQVNSNGRTIVGVNGIDRGAYTLIVDGTLYAHGATTLNSTLNVAGAATLSGGITGGLAVTGALSTTSTLAVTGAATLSGGITGGLAVTGALSATSGLTITGAITATGDITAGYSDDRLKDRFENIPNALNKVLQLNGFYYTPNKTAQQLGAVNNGQEVGVSAQEVLAVLPEIVKDAPIDTSYMTVDYAKMVPLLIEAIKGLNAKVESLEAQLKK